MSDRVRTAVARTRGKAIRRCVQAAACGVLSLLLLGACAAPGSSGDQATAVAPAVTTEPATTALPVRSCRVDGDCVVMDVGSCCGRRPACVHRDSRPDPAAIAAACARDGVASICGFAEVVACSCDHGSCRDQGASTSGWIRDALRGGRAG